MATLPKPDLTWQPMTAGELLAIRGTPEFEREYARQRSALSAHLRELREGGTLDEDYPGWTYDAEL